MPSPSKPNNHSHGARLSYAHEMAVSNSTMARFLGGRTKDWMHPVATRFQRHPRGTSQSSIPDGNRLNVLNRNTRVIDVQPQVPANSISIEDNVSHGDTRVVVPQLAEEEASANPMDTEANSGNTRTVEVAPLADGETSANPIEIEAEFDQQIFRALQTAAMDDHASGSSSEIITANPASRLPSPPLSTDGARTTRNSPSTDPWRILSQALQQKTHDNPLQPTRATFDQHAQHTSIRSPAEHESTNETEPHTDVTNSVVASPEFSVSRMETSLRYDKPTDSALTLDILPVESPAQISQLTSRPASVPNNDAPVQSGPPELTSHHMSLLPSNANTMVAQHGSSVRISQHTSLPPYTSGEQVSTPLGVPDSIITSTPLPEIDPLRFALKNLLPFINKEAASLNLRNDLSDGQRLKEGRLLLLRDACIKDDVFFLVIHQIYCFYSSLSTHQVAYFAFNDNQVSGLKTLGELILPNANLPGDSLRWLLNFPGPLEGLLCSSSIYRNTYFEVKRCLELIGIHWSSFKKDCLAHKSPPRVDFLATRMGVKSAVLQHVIFTAVQRLLWFGPQDTCFQKSDKLFLDNQEMSRNWSVQRGRGVPPPQDIINTYYKQLLAEYYRIFAQHLLHLEQEYGSRSTYRASHLPSLQLASVSSPSIQSPSIQTPPLQSPITHSPSQAQFTVSSMGPPQQRQGSIGTGDSQSPILQTTRFPNDIRPAAPAQLQANSGHGTNYSFPLGHRTQISTAHIVPSNDNQQLRHALGPDTHQLSLYQSPYSPSYASPAPVQQSQHTTSSRIYAPPQLFPPGHNNAHYPNRQASSGRRLSASSESNRAALPDTIRTTVVNARDSPHALQSPNASSPLEPRFPLLLLKRPLIPPAGYVLPYVSQPQLDNPALHQAHVRDPQLVVEDSNTGEAKREPYFQFVKGFAVRPLIIKPQDRLLSCTFHVASRDYCMLARDEPQPYGARPLRSVRNGTLIFRLRCIKLTDAKKWSSGQRFLEETSWPHNVTIVLNGTHLELRRKPHHGKDLPVDLTTYVNEGVNVLRIALIRVGGEVDTASIYAMIVEVVEVADLASVMTLVRENEESDLQDRIKRQLLSKDPDVEMLGSNISIDVVDPFTSSLIRTPARGDHCLHYECFDLSIFLQTRQGSPCQPEQFRCPICNADARPHHLVVDSWVSKILETIRKQGREDARAIIVHNDGTWEIREENGGETGKADATSRNSGLHGASLGGSSPQKANGVIVLD